jgi:hypothetical protein
MKVNLKARKTEIHWQEAIDDFWKKFTPAWFDWIQWIPTLGVITYLAKQTQSFALAVLTTVSYFALFFYLQSIFFAIEFKGFPKIKSKRLQRLLSLILSGILSIAVWLLLSSVLSKIQGKV